MDIFTIPPELVALSAITAALVLLLYGNGVSIKVLSMSLFMQFFIYVLFSIFNIPIETRQFISRLNSITVNVVLIIIVWAARRNHG